MKNKTIGYSDYYKGNVSKNPDSEDDSEDEEYGIGASLDKNNKKLTPLQEARKKALKRRLNKKVG